MKWRRAEKKLYFCTCVNAKYEEMLCHKRCKSKALSSNVLSHEPEYGNLSSYLNEHFNLLFSFTNVKKLT